jgi:hypothetical protein
MVNATKRIFGGRAQYFEGAFIVWTALFNHEGDQLPVVVWRDPLTKTILFYECELVTLDRDAESVGVEFFVENGQEFIAAIYPE